MLYIIAESRDYIKCKGRIRLFDLNIVLVEPEIPQNTGNIARTCAATGAKLHLVEPMGFHVDDKKLKRAGLDYWYLLDITYYESLADFFEKHQGENFYYFSTKAPRRHTDVSYPERVFLVFGKETAGLPEELLHNNPETTVRIPMISEARSLNLSNAAAIGVYEVLRQWGFPQLQDHGNLRNYSW
ncbi:MAG: tRNA (uridine(34)/cytosine(34)/5-carboxymethylaminomethyluridine(34)-2'-O)-methyltransferase TrmL [Clostridia bacterium]|nr:tRNA (uridine(34)/cytosine(34)/5-carboxymethylaminomethyluridine(34)-2'-O)-methyltransferase TrmL [Clostridia bacterium]